MLDWLGKMISLPEEFLAGRDGQGGGVIQVREGIELKKKIQDEFLVFMIF